LPALADPVSSGRMTAFTILSRVLYRDALMLVIDKPAGLPVHADTRGGETLTNHLDDLRFGLPRRPEIVHRLDRETSGCLVLGRHARSLARLNELFRGSEVDKVYWAAVQGGPSADEGEIDLALAQDQPARASRGPAWRMHPDPNGQSALTRFRVLGRADGHAWLELRPITGRTHQLRVHCAASGWPILGDRLYGKPDAGGPGLMLHARTITLPLYPKKPPITVTAPVPERMRDLLAACGWVPPES
jgi:tRNA pseudouridine32 synthase/23S rRNA pseudouridine746 synthase